MQDTVRDNPGVVKAERRERTWSMSDIVDYVTNYNVPISTNAWDFINTQYPIDVVPNPQATDFDKSWMDLELLRDKYLILRLYLYLNDVNVLTNFVELTKTESPR
jgi:hypothetical protein